MTSVADTDTKVQNLAAAGVFDVMYPTSTVPVMSRVTLDRAGNVKTAIDIKRRQNLNEKYLFSLSFKTNRTAI